MSDVAQVGGERLIRVPSSPQAIRPFSPPDVLRRVAVRRRDPFGHGEDVLQSVAIPGADSGPRYLAPKVGSLGMQALYWLWRISLPASALLLFVSCSLSPAEGRQVEAIGSE